MACMLSQPVTSRPFTAAFICPIWRRSTSVRVARAFPASFVPQPRRHASSRHGFNAEAAQGKNDDVEIRSTRVNKSSTSLRRVAVEAERSRGTFSGSGLQTKHRHNSGADHEAREVTAYCMAEQYDIPVAANLLRQAGYRLDPFGIKLYPQVLHLRVHKKTGDVFVFPSGTLVAWDVSPSLAHSLIHDTLQPAATNPHLSAIETEDLEFTENPSTDKSSVNGDTIRLGTKPPLHEVMSTNDTHASTTDPAPAPVDAEHQHALYLTLTKLSFSSGLARSTKLAVLETALSAYFTSTRDIPLALSRGHRFLPYTRRFVLQKLGELLSIRAQLNLYSELTDSLPDLFWDSRHELGLEGYFEQVGRALDVHVRIRALNERVDYAAEIAGVLRERLSERHSTLLEWAIIMLITVEVVFEVRRVLQERESKEVEGLLKQWLESALARERRDRGE